MPRTVLLEAARAYEGLTAVYYFANKPVTILFAALLSLNLAETAGPSPELARGYALVGVIIGFVPIHRLAEAYCRKALKMARALDNLSARAWVFLLTGIYHAGVGHWSRAQNLLEQVIDIAERLGDRSRWDDGVGNLAMIHFFRGDFERCDRLHADVLASAERRRDTHNQAWAMRGKVYVHLRRGEFDPALAALDTLQSLLRQDQQLVDEALTIDLHGMLAVVHLRRAEIEPALAAAKTGAALIAKASPSSFLSLPGYAGIAETYLSLWEREMVDRLGFEMQTINLSQIQKGGSEGINRPIKRGPASLPGAAEIRQSFPYRPTPGQPVAGPVRVAVRSPTAGGRVVASKPGPGRAVPNALRSRIGPLRNRPPPPAGRSHPHPAPPPSRASFPRLRRDV
ncbi:MAG: hypothetical protein H6633_11955 [Anaerolineales bacterium]|nr:hypothetical protein [Anaerolineales bacterium]